MGLMLVYLTEEWAEEKDCLHEDILNKKLIWFLGHIALVYTSGPYSCTEN